MSGARAALVDSPRAFRLAFVLFTLTLLSTTWAGALMNGASWSFASFVHDLPLGLSFSLPLMTILLAHELGHYVAARIHRVPASPPLFVPFPMPPLGTFGAVILMPGRIARRNALFDIGAAGPLAGMAVALPVLVYGIASSSVGAIYKGPHLVEGHSLLYVALLYLLKGPIPEGHDIQLTQTAFAGWTGLLVTMINLIPAAQLDGGHVAYSLFGERQEKLSRALRTALLPLALTVSLTFGVAALLQGTRGWALLDPFSAGSNWLVWWLVLRLMTRNSDREHPPTDDADLSPGRRVMAWLTLGLFVLLFMPVWLRSVPGAP